LDAGWQPPHQREKITLPKDNHNAGRHRDVGRRLATAKSKRKDTPHQWCGPSPGVLAVAKETPHQWCGPSPGALAVAKDKRYAQATLHLRLENINRYAQVTLYLRPENINQYAQGWGIVTFFCAMISVCARFEDVRGDRKLLVRQD